MNRIASISIIVEDTSVADRVHELLHGYRNIIIGRMGLPLREYGISLISVVVCGNGDRISALSGALGRIPSVKVKTTYSSVSLPDTPNTTEGERK